jgi:hypothetical protein
MTADDPLGDEPVEKLGSGYDITEGIPPTAHDHTSVRRVEHAGHSLEIPRFRAVRVCPILCVTGRDGHGQLAAWMRSP